MIGAPVLFQFGFQNKYTAGLAVLPWTLAYCSWFGMFAVAQNYLFCAERASLSCIALVIGLLINIGLNLLMLPVWGLHGAVWATAVANLCSLLLVYAFSAWAGMKIDRGTWLLSLTPLAVGAGLLPAIALVLLVGLAIGCGNWLLDADEKQQLIAGLRNRARRGVPPAIDEDDAQNLAAELPLV